jgi:hypothetical protein
MIEDRDSAAQHRPDEAFLAVPGEDAGHEAAWAVEIHRRVEELRSGKVKPILGEKVFEELETLFQ